MWGCAGGVFADLGPYKFGRIEFWGTGWKLIYMHARMVRQKLFHLAAAVGRMLIPHYHNRSRNVMQQMCEKSDHLLPADRVTIGLQIQLDLAFPWTHAQGANQFRRSLCSRLVRMVGVCRRGAQLRLRGETNENPLSSRKTRVAPSSRHFFYLWPDIAFPMDDRGSSRARLRRCGFWQLQPIRRKRYQTLLARYRTRNRFQIK